MDDCNYLAGNICGLGFFDGHPTKSDCASCSSYEGPSRGLGDKIHAFTKITGIKKAVDLATSGRGKPCGCNKRRTQLNKLFPSKD